MARVSAAPSATFVRVFCLSLRNRFRRTRPTRPWTCFWDRDGDPFGSPSVVKRLAQRVGAKQLLYGSDRPVVEPTRTGWDPSLQANAARLLAHAQELREPRLTRA